MIKVEIFNLFNFFKDEMRKFLGHPMTADDNRSPVKSRRGKLQMNGSDVFKDGGDDKANWYHWKGTASWSPLKIMLTSDNTTSSWSIKGDVDDGADRPILLETSIIEVSCLVLTKLFLQPYRRGDNNWRGIRMTHTVAGRFLPTIEWVKGLIKERVELPKLIFEFVRDENTGD
jgi:hypothetical protein